MDELHFFWIIVLKNESIIVFLVLIHEFLYTLALWFTYLIYFRNDDSTKKGTWFKYFQLYFFEYFSNVILIYKVKGKSLVCVVPRVRYAI